MSEEKNLDCLPGDPSFRIQVVEMIHHKLRVDEYSYKLVLLPTWVLAVKSALLNS